MKELKIDRFLGMNNVKQAEGNLREPSVILNADVSQEGRVVKRDGYSLAISLPGAHSLFAGAGLLLCAAGGTLYNLRSGVAVALSAISGPVDEPLAYCLADDSVFVSNRYWNSKIDPGSAVVSTWGIPLPEQPVAVQTSGNLPSGTYRICYTALSNGLISGNGEITTILLDSDNSGISLLNRGDNLVWVTDPDGDTFYLAGPTDLVASATASEPLPTFLCTVPPFMSNLAYAFGRVWGSREKTLYYSEPFRPDLFRTGLNTFSFPHDITMIASMATGIFIGTEEATYALIGDSPEKMHQEAVGSGAISGTLAYCNNVKHLGDTISPEEKVHNSVPIWMSQDGIVLGNSSGKLYNLTKLKAAMECGGIRGAGLYRQKGGVFQYLSSFKLGRRSDNASTAIKNGRIFEPPSVPGQGEAMGFSDSVSCTVYRNGIPV